MKISKKFSIILFIILILFSFTATSWGWNNNQLWMLDEYVQYEDDVPKFMMPGEIIDYLQNDCPHYADYLNGTYEILITKNGYSTNTGRWYIIFLEPDTQVWLTGKEVYYNTSKECIYYRCEDDGNYNFYFVENNLFKTGYFDGEWVNGSNVFCGASTIPIYNSDKSTTFFQGAPLKGRLAQTILLHQLDLTLVLEEILKILPLILVVMVSLIGFRKAWNLLLTILKTS